VSDVPASIRNTVLTTPEATSALVWPSMIGAGLVNIEQQQPVCVKICLIELFVRRFFASVVTSMAQELASDLEEQIL
jgi:hypothetical protein